MGDTAALCNLTPRCTVTRLVCHALFREKVAPDCGAPVSASVSLR